MRPLINITALFLVLYANYAEAKTSVCSVQTKIDFLSGIVYSEQQIKDMQFSVLLNTADKTVSRCSFVASEGKVTCDTYQFDREEKAAGFVDISKYYYFSGQFDLQVFGSGQFIENNGRGSIATGFCN